MSGNVEVVYRCEDENERKRRVNRAKVLVGTPWIYPPVALHKVCLVIEGQKIRAEALGMVFNDACLMDACSGWGEDGPFYRDTVSGNQLRCYSEALKLYAGVEIPKQLQNPNTPNGHPPPANAAGGSSSDTPEAK